MRCRHCNSWILRRGPEWVHASTGITYSPNGGAHYAEPEL